jgi:hypothetical protein
MSARGFENVLYCPRPIFGVQSIDPAVSKVLQRITASHLPPEATDVAASPLKISDENHYWRRISQSAKIGRAFEHHVLGGAVSLGKILEEILLSKIAGLRHTHNSRGSRKPNSYQTAGEVTRPYTNRFPKSRKSLTKYLGKRSIFPPLLKSPAAAFVSKSVPLALPLECSWAARFRGVNIGNQAHFKSRFIF